MTIGRGEAMYQWPHSTWYRTPFLLGPFQSGGVHAQRAKESITSRTTQVSHRHGFLPKCITHSKRHRVRTIHFFCSSCLSSRLEKYLNSNSISNQSHPVRRNGLFYRRIGNRLRFHVKIKNFFLGLSNFFAFTT